MTDNLNVPRELKPCPFCGGEPNLTTADYVHDDLTPMPVVECKSCSAWVQADDWNTRAPSLSDHVEDVRAMVAAPSPAGVEGLEVVGYASAGQMAIMQSGAGEGMKVKREQSGRYTEPVFRRSDAKTAIAAERSERASNGVDGCRMVPIEPTREMLEAAEEAYFPFGDMDIALRLAILSAPDAPSTAPQHERDSKELRRLCAERDHVRKERDQLSQRVGELEGLLREVSSGLRCENLHHKKAEQHEFDEPCKVLTRIDAALAERPQAHSGS